MNRPNINSLTATANYQKDPLAIYHALTQNRKSTLLYESADIDHQHALKSIMILQSSLRISALKEIATVEALTKNGEIILDYLKEELKRFFLDANENSIRFQFPLETIELNSPLDLLRAIQRLADPEINNQYSTFIGGLLGYDLVGVFKGITIPQNNRELDLSVYLAETLLIVDHIKETTTLQTNIVGNDPDNEQALHDQFKILQTRVKKDYRFPNEDRNGADKPIVDEDDPDAFIQTVSELKKRIEKEEFAQIVPSRKFRIPCNSPIHAYDRLKQAHPSPYLFYMNDPDFILFGASPESALKYDHKTRELELYPIAGTKPRGRINGLIDRQYDRAMEAELKNDKKEVAEHLMLVDLAKDDLGTIAFSKSVKVRDLMKVDRYAYVMHLVSRVTATLNEDLDALDAYVATMNMGTLTGSPKNHAMETIYHYETEARGSYGGAIGYFNSFGDLDSCIVIRSAIVKDGIATVQAGAGIVNDSDPKSELEETRIKANSVIRAIVDQ